MKQWKHDELAEDLGDTKQTNFLNVHLGSPYLQNSVQRADVMEIKPSYTRFCVSIYEVKISRSDFQSDIRSGKWLGYLEHCHRFYFATPSGMVKKEEIPDGAGLIVRGENGWKVLKPAAPREVEIPYMTLLSLTFVNQRENFQALRRSAIYRAQSYYNRKNIYKALGKKVGTALQNYDEYVLQKDNFKYYRDRIEELIKEGLGKDCLHPGWPDWDLEDLVDRIKQKAKHSEASNG
jgi:hypothetical protein